MIPDTPEQLHHKEASELQSNVSASDFRRQTTKIPDAALKDPACALCHKLLAEIKYKVHMYHFIYYLKIQIAVFF